MADDNAAQARPRQLPVVANRAYGGRFRELVLHAPDLVATLRAGQFVNVLAADGLDPFLRRPFSVYRLDHDAGTLSLLYDVVGRGTRLMAHWEPGTLADVLAPLGNGFEVPAGTGALALVAGGIGVAPLVALAQQLAPSGRPLYALLGARTADLLLGEADLRAYGAQVAVATDDGSRGHHGVASDLLASLLQTGKADMGDLVRPESVEMVLTCGPRAMMAATSRVALAAGVPCQVSMEVGMACGFGVCMGCAWRVRPQPGATESVTYRLVCTDGPVFDAAEIIWDE